MKSLKRLTRAVLYVVYLCVVVLAVDYVFYVLYKPRITRDVLSDIPLRGIEAYVGPVPGRKRESSFRRFSLDKKPGVIRIGCFGDSFTFGDETSAAYDFPSLLHNIFLQHGYQNIEVLNFGIPWAGFHQAYLMWRYVGYRFNLDYVVVGPKCPQYARDDTFNHAFTDVQRFNNFCQEDLFGERLELPVTDQLLNGFHGRFILRHGRAELVAPFGVTARERIQNYWCFIPRWRYIRYDQRSPLFVDVALRYLTNDSKYLRNPFYYRSDLVHEMDTIFGQLLGRMASVTPQVILGHYDNHIIQVGRAASKKNIFSTQLFRPTGFPYVARKSHNSPTGNLIVAKQMFACLTNERVCDLTLIETFGLSERQTSHKRLPQPLSLPNAENMAFEIEGREVGGFFSHVPFRDFRFLVAFGGSDTSIINGVFFPINFSVHEGQAVIMRVQHKNQFADYGIGKIRIVHPDIPIAAIVDGGTFHVEAAVRSGIVLAAELDIIDDSDYNIAPGDTITFLVDNQIIAVGSEKKGSINVTSALGTRSSVIRSLSDVVIDADSLPSHGVVNMVIYSENHEHVLARIPFVGWKKIHKQVLLTGKRAHHISRRK